MVKHSIASVLGCGLAILLLSSCSTPVQQIQVTAKPIEKPELTLPSVDRLEMREIEWVIITEENYKEVFAKLKKTGRPLAVFGLTDKGYANLGLNFSDIRALVQQQKTIIAAYEAYYKDANNALENANKQVDEVNNEVKELNNKQPKESTLQKFNPFK
jgi:peptidoglycan hydrolase CwlO-like protein